MPIRVQTYDEIQVAVPGGATWQLSGKWVVAGLVGNCAFELDNSESAQCASPPPLRDRRKKPAERQGHEADDRKPCNEHRECERLNRNS